MTLLDFEKKKNRLPDAPGVYFFLGPHKEILYIGKAASLRDRVRSYFSPDLAAMRSAFIAQMVDMARGIDWRQTDSVLEALILEASLIKTHKPRYNTLAKDDKSFNHVVITDEDFPRVLVARGKDLDVPGLILKTKNLKLKTVFGPFPHGLQLKEAMKLIRKIFPFRDRCEPCVQKQTITPRATCRPCFNRQIGLCPGVCTGEISKAAYARTIRHLELLFAGHKKMLLQALERGMKRAAKAEEFEEAARLRGQLFALQHIQDVSLIKDDIRALSASGSGEPSAYRIEGYDTAHWAGEGARGVMTVVEHGEAVKAQYRVFTIRTAKAGDDTGALREALERRLTHPEWPLPQLIVVDGGVAQQHAAEAVVADAALSIPVVAVTKDEHHRARGILGDRPMVREHEREILLVNAEAHRFSIAKHRRTRKII